MSVKRCAHFPLELGADGVDGVGRVEIALVQYDQERQPHRPHLLVGQQLEQVLRRLARPERRRVHHEHNGARVC